MLRWLIRNRQKKGIEKRYEDDAEGDRGAGDHAAAARQGPMPEADRRPHAETPSRAARRSRPRHAAADLRRRGT